MTSKMSTSDSIVEFQQSPKSPDLSRPTDRRLLVVWRDAGAASQVWAERQIQCFDEFNTSILHWVGSDSEPYQSTGARTLAMTTARAPYNTSRRWVMRACGLRHRNFYAAVGAEAKRFRRELLAGKFDVILCHFGYESLRILDVASELAIPVVAHFHGCDISSSLDNRWYASSLRANIRRFAACVCVGSHQRQRLINLGGDPDRIYLIPCGVPTKNFQPCDETKKYSQLTSSTSTLRFICVCRLVPWKGVDVAIRALAAIDTQLGDWRLTVIGDGPEKESLRQLAISSGIAEHVVFRGNCNQSQVRDEMNRSDIFLQHSLTIDGWDEGFGVSIAEAAASEIPVVVSDCGGIADHVQHEITGIVVAEGGVQEFSDSILRLAKDPQWRSDLGKAGRGRMVEHFDASNQSKKLQAVLLHACQ